MISRVDRPWLFRFQTWIIGHRVSPDLLLFLLVTVIALVPRFPRFMTIPALTDEYKEIYLAIQIAVGSRLPLVAVDPYDGPLFAYLVGAAYRVFGLNLFVARGFVLVVGALTVGAAYLFARELARGDRRAALLAALLLGLNTHHILFNSHVAWSNDTTPLFTTLALWAYLRATRGGDPRGFLAAGILFGCALQTHPSALALAPGVALDFLLNRPARASLRSPWPYLAALAGLVVYSPVIYFNLKTRLDSLHAAGEQSYAFIAYPSIPGAVAGILPTIAAIGRTALGSLSPATAQSLWTDPLMVLFLLLTVAAFGLLWRRGERFPAAVTGAAVLFLATFNNFRAIPDSTRYFQDLSPIIMAAWSILLLAAWDRAGGWAARWQAPFVRAGVGLVVLLLLVYPQYKLWGYYGRMELRGQNNAGMLQMVERSREHRAAPVLIEEKLAGLRTGRGGAISADLEYLFLTDRRPTESVSLSTPQAVESLRDRLREQDAAYLIGFPNAPDILGPEFPLRQLARTRFLCRSCRVSNEFVLFYWEKAPQDALDY